MEEKEPAYFKEFRRDINIRFDSVERKIETTVEKAVDDLAVITAKHFARLDGEVAIIKGDIVQIKTDIVDIKADIVGIKSNIDGWDQNLID